MSFEQQNNYGMQQTAVGYVNPMYGEERNRIGEYDLRNHFDVIANGVSVQPISISLAELSDVKGVFKKCAPLQAIIGRTAEAATNGVFCVKSVENNTDISFTTLKYRRIVNLLRKPNPLQSCEELLSDLYTYFRLYGGVYLFAGVPESMSHDNATTLWVFAPTEVQVVFKKNPNTFFLSNNVNDLIEKYVITPINTNIPPFNTKPEFVIPLYDTAETEAAKTGVVEAKRVKGLHYEIRNVMQSQEAIYSLSADRGAQGIISNAGKDAIGYVPLLDEEKGDLERRFRGNYGLMRSQEKVVVTNSPITYTQIGFNVKDLMLYDGLRTHIMSMCDAFSFPFNLLASEKGKTAADTTLAMVSLYQDNVIPLANKIAAKLSLFFGLEQNSAVIQIDFAHLPIMQSQTVEKNNALRQLMQACHIAYANDAISREEFRRLIGVAEQLPAGSTLRSETGASNTRNDVRVTTA